MARCCCALIGYMQSQLLDDSAVPVRAQDGRRENPLFGPLRGFYLFYFTLYLRLFHVSLCASYCSSSNRIQRSHVHDISPCSLAPPSFFLWLAISGAPVRMTNAASAPASPCPSPRQRTGAHRTATGQCGRRRFLSTGSPSSWRPCNLDMHMPRPCTLHNQRPCPTTACNLRKWRVVL